MRIETCQLYAIEAFAVGPGQGIISTNIQARTYRPWYIHAVTVGGFYDTANTCLMPVGYGLAIEDFFTLSGGGNAPATAPPVEWPLDPGGDSWEKSYVNQIVPPGNNRIIIDRLLNPGQTVFTPVYLFAAAVVAAGTFNYNLLIEFCPDESWRRP